MVVINEGMAQSGVTGYVLRIMNSWLVQHYLCPCSYITQHRIT